VRITRKKIREDYLLFSLTNCRLQGIMAYPRYWVPKRGSEGNKSEP
jgi:hypothetical protein